MKTLLLLIQIMLPSSYATDVGPSRSAPAVNIVQPAVAVPESQDPFMNMRDRANREIQVGNFQIAEILMQEIIAKAPADNVVRKVIAADQKEMQVKVKIAKEVIAENDQRIKKGQADLAELHAKIQAKKKEKDEIQAKTDPRKLEAENQARLNELKQRKAEAAKRLKQAEDRTRDFDKSVQSKRQGFDKRMDEIEKKAGAARSKPMTLDTSDQLRAEIKDLETQRREVERQRRDLENEKRQIENEERTARQDVDNADREVQRVERERNGSFDRPMRAIEEEITALERQFEYQQEQVNHIKHLNEELMIKLPTHG